MKKIFVSVLLAYLVLWLFCNPLHSQTDDFENEIQILFEKAIDRDPTVKFEAKMELRELGKVCFNQLEKALQDKRAEMRYLACELIAEFRDERFKDKLIPFLKDFEGDATSIASVAAWALGRIGAKDATDELINSLDTKDPELKHNAIQALGILRAHQAKDKLIELLNDNTVTYFSERIDVAAIIALGQLKEKDAIPKLVNLLTNRTIDVARGEEVRYYAARALERITGENNGPLSGDKETIEKTYLKWSDWWEKNRHKYETQPPKDETKDEKEEKKVENEKKEEKKDENAEKKEDK